MSELVRNGAPPCVLIVDDDEWAMRSLESVLGPMGVAFARAYTGRQAIERARTLPVDAVIVDAVLPDMTGADVARLLRESPWFSATVPVLVVTSVPTRRIERLEAFDAGAWEHLTLPTDTQLLSLRMRNYLDARRAAVMLRDGSLVDPTSRLYNRLGLERRMQEIASETARHRAPLACAVIGMEDTAADRTEESCPCQGAIPAGVAEGVGSLLRAVGRSSDAIARMADAQFAVVAPRTGPGQAVLMLDRLFGAVENALGDARHSLRLRAGYAAVTEFAGPAVEATRLLEGAARALDELLHSAAHEPYVAFEAVTRR